MRRHLAALGLALCLLCPLALDAAPWKRYGVLEGTDFAAQYYVSDSGQAGKRVLLIAPHSDEESAGQWLEEFIGLYTPKRGALVACPWPVAPAKRMKSRFYIEDLNRQFDWAEDNNTAIDIIAHSVQSWIRMYKIDCILNMHEGYGQFRLNWTANYGQSLFIDTPELVPLAERLAKQVNARIDQRNRFLAAQIPMPGTLTWYAQALGVPAIGVEIDRNLPRDRRLTYQRIVLEEFFKIVDIPLEAVKK